MSEKWLCNNGNYWELSLLLTTTHCCFGRQTEQQCRLGTEWKNKERQVERQRGTSRAHIKNGWIIRRSSELEMTDIVYSLTHRRKSVYVLSLFSVLRICTHTHSIHSLYTQPTQCTAWHIAGSLYTSCHCSVSYGSVHIHPAYTHCTLIVHRVYTHCTHTVHSVHTLTHTVQHTGRNQCMSCHCLVSYGSTHTHTQWTSLSYNCRSAELLSSCQHHLKTEQFDIAYSKREHSA